MIILPATATLKANDPLRYPEIPFLHAIKAVENNRAITAG